jgi:hypothetical protein
MKRNMIIPVIIMCLLGLTFSVIIIALSPLWITVVIIDPNLMKPISDFVIQTTTKQAVKMVVGSVNRLCYL